MLEDFAGIIFDGCATTYQESYLSTSLCFLSNPRDRMIVSAQLAQFYYKVDGAMYLGISVGAGQGGETFSIPPPPKWAGWGGYWFCPYCKKNMDARGSVKRKPNYES